MKMHTFILACATMIAAMEVDIVTPRINRWRNDQEKVHRDMASKNPDKVCSLHFRAHDNNFITPIMPMIQEAQALRVTHGYCTGIVLLDLILSSEQKHQADILHHVLGQQLRHTCTALKISLQKAETLNLFPTILKCFLNATDSNDTQHVALLSTFLRNKKKYLHANSPTVQFRKDLKTIINNHSQQASCKIIIENIISDPHGAGAFLQAQRETFFKNDFYPSSQRAQLLDFALSRNNPEALVLRIQDISGWLKNMPEFDFNNQLAQLNQSIKNQKPISEEAKKALRNLTATLRLKKKGLFDKLEKEYPALYKLSRV